MSRWHIEHSDMEPEHVSTTARVHIAVLGGTYEATGELFYSTACGTTIGARTLTFHDGPATCLRCIVIMDGAGS